MTSLSGKRILLWGAYPRALSTLEHRLEGLGARTERVDSLEEILVVLRTQDVDLVVAQLCEGFVGPLDLLARLGREPSPPVLMVAGALDIPLYLEAMRRGAFDCIGLPLDETELLRIVTCALEAQNARVPAGEGSS